jgi:Tol biopolymer transport system component/predicted Ser/Thr protein kinase
MTLSSGDRLGAYEILAPIGEGGMGSVYKAHDPTLQRTVAIKVLTKQDDGAAPRLLQEARAASALDHPNICTVHEVGEHEGQPFIVMAYVEGQPLSQIIPADGLPPESVIRYGTQIADALAHAHEHGIVHRDLKSANVVITPEGRAKVLDFGLAARMPQTDAEAVTKTQEAIPHAGILVGTLAYMAPEVLRGEAATARSDIWALGVLLYEMASGTQPFTGTTQTDVVSAIVKESTSPLPAKVSPGLRNVIQHCLTKEPARRYPHSSAIQAALETIQSDAVAQPAGIVPAGGTGIWRVAAAALVVALAIGLGYWLRPSSEPTATSSTVLSLMNPVQITSAVGIERGVAWSPDAEMLAYESDQTGNWDVWVTQPGSGQPVNRTADHAGNDRYPAWSQDGRQIAFLSDRDSVGEVFVMSPLGGTPRKVGSFSGSAQYLQWLNDGSELTARVNPVGQEIVAEILTVSTGELRQVALPGRTAGRNEPRWSPDGQLVAYADPGGWNYQVKHLLLVQAAGGAVTAISDGMTEDGSPSWSPDSTTLYFVSNRGGSKDLWQQRISDAGLPEGEPAQVSVGIGMSEAIVSPDGTKLAYVRGGPIRNMWRIPILDDRPATWADAEQLTFDVAAIHGMDVSPDGTRLVLSSERSGNPDLWTMPAEGGEMQQLTTDPTPDWAVRWSPDGEQVAFYAYRSGNRDIWIMPAGGGTARQLTTHEADEWYPDWSPDGTEIVFASQRGGTSGIWIVSVESGEERLLADSPVADNLPAWSPDGQWVAFRSSRSGRNETWRIPARGGEPEQLTTAGGANESVWSPDGREIYFWRGGQSRQFWALSMDTRSVRPLTDLTGRRGSASIGEMSTDGRYLYFAWGGREGDIWVMDVVDEE